MNQVELFLDQQKVRLDQNRFLAAGGEGRVYALDQSHVVKLYHQPTAQKAEKLHYLYQLAQNQILPEVLLTPTALATDAHGRIIGYAMKRLGSHFHPFFKLGHPQKTAQLNLVLNDALLYLEEIRRTLAALHQHGLVVGDLNDQNIYFNAHKPGQTAWIDLDSYQLGHFPCPVAAPNFLDPHLFHIQDFSANPVFSQSSDWYAFCVLLTQTILGVHPYGGVHHHWKSVAARAQAGISILEGSVDYPALARPLSLLSPPLREMIDRVFREGYRPVISAHFLADYAQFLSGSPSPTPILPRPTPRTRHPLPRSRRIERIVFAS